MITVSPCLRNIDADPNLDFMGLAARKSGGYAGAYSAAQIAWLFLARRDAEAMNPPDFSESDFLMGLLNCQSLLWKALVQIFPGPI
jgi:hypothetical protein